MDIVANLTGMLQRGQDTALLRFSLGSELLKRAEHGAAIEHLQAAILKDPDYSAAYKNLGKAYVAHDEPEAAKATFTKGIAVAEAQGDKQAAKEMTVFLKRLHRG